MQQNFQLHKGNAFISDMSQPPSAQTTWMREAEPTRLVWNDDETLAEERREASAKRDPEAAIASKEVSVPRATPAPTAAAAEHSFSNARKYTLLVIFCVASVCAIRPAFGDKLTGQSSSTSCSLRLSSYSQRTWCEIFKCSRSMLPGSS